jgi:intracellular sulfur oxidation DsrE/DsrF family protein
MIIINTVLQKNIMILFLLFMSISPLSIFADEEAEMITEILEMNETPDGVVFELIGSEDSDYLPNALKKVEAYKKQLQTKFPKLEFAIVSHGAEQFELMKSNADDEKESHKRVQRLVAADVPVHICETHASWRGNVAEDFPDYITPSPQGPAQIKQYQELGYRLIVID